MHLTQTEARRILLAHQGLLGPLAAPKSKRPREAALQVIEHLGYVQIDTIAVIERAHHHTIWTRLPKYEPKLLHALQAEDRTVLEYWSHAASYLPMKDYRFCLPRMHAYASGKRHWFPRDRKLMKQITDRIRAEGPLSAKDFEAPPGTKSGPWFEWKPAKRALEQLFMEGALLVRERKNFQKVYDLPERVLPKETDTRMPTESEVARHLIFRSLRTAGIASAREIAYLRTSLKRPVAKALEELLEERLIEPVQIEGVTGEAYYAQSGLRSVGAPSRAQVRFLSPFDNSVIQRKRLQRFFGFDYQIECYVPEPKRIYGYFTLPVLFGDALVGRMDTKADRTSETLLVRGLWLENKFDPTDAFVTQFAQALERFARFNGCKRVSVELTQNRALVARLKRELAGPS